MPLRSHRWSAALLVAGLALGTVACSSDDGSDGSASTTAAPTEETTTTVDAEATTTTADATTTAPEAGATTTAPEGEATTTAPEGEATTTAPSGAEPSGDPVALEAFADLVEANCGGELPEVIGTEAGGSDDEVVIVDTEGNRLVVNLADDVVYGLDGPDGDLPAVYSTGCESDVFQGTKGP